MERHLLLNRRNLLKMGLALPVIGSLRWKSASASPDGLLLPDEYLNQAESIYGKRAYATTYSQEIDIKVAEIAENSAQVPISISAPGMSFFSILIFVERNPVALSASCFLYAGGDAPVSLRLKVVGSSDIFVVADTSQGLLFNKCAVKVTIGCGEV